MKEIKKEKGKIKKDMALEFPDWSGMQPHRSRMTFEEAVRWNDEILSLFPRRKMPPKLEMERRCLVEFVL